MVNFGKKVVKYRVLILILGVLLLIPSVFGYLNTRVNYDVLTYLPDNIETMKGQDILVNDFGTGAFSMFIVDGMEEKDVAELKEKIEKVDHVAFIGLGEQFHHGVAQFLHSGLFLERKAIGFLFHHRPSHHPLDERKRQEGKPFFELPLALDHLHQLLMSGLAHTAGQRTGVGEDQPLHHFRVAGGDDLGHYAAQRLSHQPDLFLQMAEQFCHGVGKLAVVRKLELIVKGQHRKIPGEPGKVLIKQVGQPNAAREQDQRGFGLGILIVAIGKGFPAADREGSGWINPAKFCKCHEKPPLPSLPWNAIRTIRSFSGPSAILAIRR